MPRKADLRSPSSGRNKTPIPQKRPRQNYDNKPTSGRAAAARQRKEIAEARSNRRPNDRTSIPTFSRELILEDIKKKNPHPGPDWKQKR